MFYFKKISSATMNLVVAKTPAISKGKKRIERISVPGRSGFLTIDEGTYDSFIIAMECHLNEGTADVDAVLGWLDGTGSLSLDGVREWDAVVVNSISLEKVVGSFKSFLIQFEVQPISREIQEAVATISISPTTLNIDMATAQMQPICELTGTGDVQITINNKSFNLADMGGTYILDSNLKVITDSLGNNMSHKMLHDFPVLQPGANEISWTGAVTEIVLKYHKAYL